jgi:CRISPR-associated protein Cas5d
MTIVIFDPSDVLFLDQFLETKVPSPLEIPFIVRCHVSGSFACFTRPELKVERVSYDVMTPSAARGILEAIYWKPEIRWHINRIHVLNPIRFSNIRRNEVASKIASGSVSGAMKTNEGSLALYADEDRQQRASIILKDVAYVIEAHFGIKTVAPERTRSEELAKHHHIVKRRMISGQCFHQPYFGCREFPVDFRWIDSHDQIPLADPSLKDRDLGYLLHDMDHGTKILPRFFKARLVDGVLEVPAFDSTELIS